MMETEMIDKLFLELSQVTKATTAKEGDLAMLVRRLVRRMDRVHPQDDVAEAARDYLKRKGLNGSILRDESPPVSVPVVDGQGVGE